MFTIATDTPANTAARILKWSCILRRLRPVRLAVVARQLRDVRRKVQSLRLIERHFPDALAGIDLEQWSSIFSTFLGLVEEAGWFEVDWLLLDQLYEWWMQDCSEDGMETGGECGMADYLEGIPIKTYGWGDETLLNEVSNHWRVVLVGLLIGRVDISEVLIDLEIYDNLTEEVNEEIWQRIERGELARYPEPLCWLPELARLVCGQTGNPLLDYGADVYDLDPFRYRWDTDIEQLRELWQEARPVAAHYDTFGDWINSTPDGLGQMIMALTGWEELLPGE